MGKTKITAVDDSVIVEEKPRKKINPNPEKAKMEKSSKPEVISADASIESKKVNPNPEKAKAKKQSKVEKREAKKVREIKHGKKYLEASEKVEKNKKYPITEAVELTKEVSFTKFDGSIEIHINANVKNLRGLVSLPFASGKKLKVLAFGKGAEESGADLIGDDESFKEIEKGKINFDVLLATPDWMPKLARAAKILGPRGLMPNPKNGTIAVDLKKAVMDIQSGKVEYKTEKSAPVVHLSLGKVSQPSSEIEANIRMLLSTIGKTKIKKAVLAPTMGPGIKIDLSSI